MIECPCALYLNSCVLFMHGFAQNVTINSKKLVKIEKHYIVILKIKINKIFICACLCWSVGIS